MGVQQKMKKNAAGLMYWHGAENFIGVALDGDDSVNGERVQFTNDLSFTNSSTRPLPLRKPTLTAMGKNYELRVS